MIRRKLTARVKEQIKNGYNKLRLKDFDGEALAYLKNVRQLDKARKKKSEYTLTVGGETLKRGTEGYRIVEQSARNKNQSIKKFVQENEKAIIRLLKGHLAYGNKEIDYLEKDISDLPDDKKVFIPVKGKEVSKVKAQFLLHSLKQHFTTTTDAFIVFSDYAYDLKGNFHITIPYPIEYNDIAGDDFLQWIDENYPHITYIIS